MVDTDRPLQLIDATSRSNRLASDSHPNAGEIAIIFRTRALVGPEVAMAPRRRLSSVAPKVTLSANRRNTSEGGDFEDRCGLRTVVRGKCAVVGDKITII